MKIVKNAEIRWVYFDKHDMFGRVHDDLPNNEYADVMFAKIIPNHTLHKHWHSRPGNDGYESFFFYQGADIELQLQDSNVIFHEEEPFTVTFYSNEIHGIKNIGSKDLYFQVLTAPHFSDDEEHFVK